MPAHEQANITAPMASGVPSLKNATSAPDRPPKAKALAPSNAAAVPLLAGKNSIAQAWALETIRDWAPIATMTRTTVGPRAGAGGTTR